MAFLGLLELSIKFRSADKRNNMTVVVLFCWSQIVQKMKWKRKNDADRPFGDNVTFEFFWNTPELLDT